MKRSELVGWLKGIIVIASAMGAILCFVIAPFLGNGIALANQEIAYLYWPCLIFVWVTAVPFYVALVESWRICGEVQKGRAFCERNVKRLKQISRLALAECIIYFAALAFLAVSNLLHPAVLLLILVILCIGFAIAVFAAVLSHLTAKAGALQDENDLTI